MKKSVFVTGAGRGIGRATALRLSEAGYVVYGCARSMKELEETRTLSGGKINIASVDVTQEASLASWFKESMKDSSVQPWGLVTAAGIYGPIGSFLSNNWADWKVAIEINLHGAALTTKLFAQALIDKKLGGRIIMLSGGGATKPMPNFSSYAASKSAVVRFAETLALELKEFGFSVNSVAPGAINTKLTDELLQAGPEKAGKEMYQAALKQKEGGGQSPTRCADLVNYLLKEETAAINGRLISAIWDPWETMLENHEIMKNPEIYTLRRVLTQES